jgi:hypothetical protein
MRARDYSSSASEFTEVDPLLTDTDQPYIYADDDPDYASDKTGKLFGWDNLVAGAIGAVVGVGGVLLNDLVYGKPVNWGDVAIGAGTGFAYGFLADECGLCAEPILGAVTGAGDSIATQLNDTGSVNPLSVVGSAALGWLTGGADEYLGSGGGEHVAENSLEALVAGFWTAPQDLAVGVEDPVNFSANMQILACSSAPSAGPGVLAPEG